MSKKDYKCRRVSMRLTEGEWRMLSELSKRGNFPTVSNLIRSLLFAIVHDLRLACDGKMSLRGFVDVGDEDENEDISGEIRSMFSEMETEGGAREWPADINGRR